MRGTIGKSNVAMVACLVLIAIACVRAENQQLDVKRQVELREFLSSLTSEERKALAARLDRAVSPVNKPDEIRQFSLEENEFEMSAKTKDILKGARRMLEVRADTVEDSDLPKFVPYQIVFNNYPYVICGKTFVGDFEHSRWPSMISEFMLSYSTMIGSIGSVVTQEIGGSAKVIGTGFMIGHDKVMTAGHVAKWFAQRADGDSWRIRHGLSVEIDFGREYRPHCGAQRIVQVVGIEKISDYPSDVSILKVSIGGPPPLTIGKPKVGDLIFAVGYPVEDPRYNLDLQRAVYKLPGDKRVIWGIKRIAGGKIKDWYAGTDGRLFAHNATTVGGNSGSPLVRASDGVVVGLHIGAPPDLAAPGEDEVSLAVALDGVSKAISLNE